MKTVDEIYEELKAECQSKTGLTFSDSGDMAVRLRAFAAQVYSLFAQQEYVMRQAFPQSADGEYLDRHAEVRGLARTGALKAGGAIRFELAEALPADLAIEAGQSCSTAAGVEFVTTGAGVIAAGELSCTVDAEAKAAGTAGNVPAGSICNMMLAPAGVSSCTNPEAFSGGAEEETDEELRERVLASYRTLPNGANRAYYESTVLDCGGVAAVTVLPKNRGLGTVDIIITSDAGEPSDSLIQEVSERLEADREICVDISVSAPDIVEVTVNVSVLADTGYDFADVSSGVTEAIQGFFTGKRLGSDVLLAQLGNLIYEVEGVKNYKITSPAEDVAVQSDELPVLASLTVSELEG